jgi:hypothetical protein
MEEFEAGQIQLELKYCERCGGLWLRLKGSDAVYCAGCSRAMAGLPGGGRRRHAISVDWVEAPTVDTPIDDDERASIELFWTEGGNA